MNLKTKVETNIFSRRFHLASMFVNDFAVIGLVTFFEIFDILVGFLRSLVILDVHIGQGVHIPFDEENCAK